MLHVLSLILCVLENLALAVVASVVLAFNAIVAAIGALLEALVLLLPPMPTEAPSPSSGILGALNWFVPIGPLLGGFLTMLGLWLSFLAVRWGLKYLRAL